MIRFLTALNSLLFLFTSLETYADVLTTLPPGTEVRSSNRLGWNRIVLVASPRIASGDTDSLSKSIRNAVSSFHLTIMAEVARDPRSLQHRLVNVGVGYSVPIDDKLKVVDSQNASRLGVSLGFMQNQVLSRNESQIAKIPVIVRSSTLLIFDTPAIFYRSGKHRDFVNRHLIWVNPETGKLRTAVWLMQEREGTHRPASEDPLRVLGMGTHEDRIIHVDKEEFFLGIPGERAFALVDLPPGNKIPWNEQLEALACRDAYDATTLSQLATALNEAMQSIQAVD